MKSEIGLAIRLARVATGKTQAQVADGVGLHPVVLNYIERGKRVPKPVIAKAIFDEIRANAPRSPLVSAIMAELEKAVNVDSKK